MTGNATKPKLLDQVRDVLRLHQYSIATERIYLHWIKRFILFHGKRHPATMGKKEMECVRLRLGDFDINRGALGARSPLDSA